MQSPPQARAILAQFLTGVEEVGYRIGVPSVWPSGSNVTITGSGTITGQVLTGATPPPLQFGTPTTRIGGPPQIQAVTGIGSSQAFGTIRTAVKAPIGAVNSAQSFGVPTPKAVVNLSIGGVSSSQAFGAPTIKTVIRSGAGGVGSAQAFGTVTVLATYRASVPGVGSAQAFGAITTRTGFTRSVGSVPSAQAFGVVLAVFKQTVQVGGVASPQAFGLLATKTALRPGAVPSAQAFGSIHVVYWQPLRPAGLGSAQAFGSTSAGLRVFNVWLHDLTCIEDDLAALAETDLALAALDCIEPDRTICGYPSPTVTTPPTICGNVLCGGVGYFVNALDCLIDSPVSSIVNTFVVGTTRVGEQAITYLDPAPAPRVFALQPAGVS